MTRNISKPDTPQASATLPRFASFTYQERLEGVLGYRVRKMLFERLTRRSTNLFLRAGDVISNSPQLTGAHEPVIAGLIKHFCEVGYSDFLLDIGANIGLMSCQTGKGFRRVEMFEPNPYCCKILEVNAAIALGKTEYHVHQYGLGDEDISAILTVPIHNWGGAFIKGDANSYDDKTLANKDCLESLVDDNYIDVDIHVRKASSALTSIFADLEDREMRMGVIKIDVEGYEPAVLKGIAASIPDGIKVLIVFESWKSDFNMNSVLTQFRGRAVAYKLLREAPWKKSWPNFLRGLALLVKPRFLNRIGENSSSDWSGDIVLMVN